MSDDDRKRLTEIAQQIEYTIKDADWPEFAEGDPADPMDHVRFLRKLAEQPPEEREGQVTVTFTRNEANALITPPLARQYVSRYLILRREAFDKVADRLNSTTHNPEEG